MSYPARAEGLVNRIYGVFSLTKLGTYFQSARETTLMNRCQCQFFLKHIKNKALPAIEIFIDSSEQLTWTLVANMDAAFRNRKKMC